jgi:BlaI family penicillinase repressor
MSARLTELQLAILSVLWRVGEASVIDIHEQLRPQRRIAQSTISTLLARLEKKGHVTHLEEGRQYHYRAITKQDAARRDVTADFLEQAKPLYSGDMGLLVSHLLGEKSVTPEDIARAREVLREMAERAQDAE